MSDELTDLLDAAMYKEIASQASYIAGQKKTRDPAAKALMKELAEAELKHSRWLKGHPDLGSGCQLYYLPYRVKKVPFYNIDKPSRWG